ncbi:MAG: protein kinase, partial [Myxococcales bacterium]|nr:protein kinase [Myxococcales bacterium]
MKPENIMIQRVGLASNHVTLLDFGIAQVDGRRDTTSGENAPNVITGTPRYMSPEQIRGEVVDGRSDLYSVGCVLHEMLSGSPPFLGDNSVEVMFKHLNRARPSLPAVRTSSGLRRTLETLHASLLHPNLHERPLDASRAALVFHALASRRTLRNLEKVLFEPTFQPTGLGRIREHIGSQDPFGSLRASVRWAWRAR